MFPIDIEKYGTVCFAGGIFSDIESCLCCTGRVTMLKDLKGRARRSAAAKQINQADQSYAGNCRVCAKRGTGNKGFPKHQGTSGSGGQDRQGGWRDREKEKA